MSWWALDAAGFVLSQPEFLDRPATPLDISELIPWIEKTCLPWAPGSGDLYADIPLDDLSSVESDWELISLLLREASQEALESDGVSAWLRTGSVGLAARRRLPLTTLALYSGDVTLSAGALPTPLGLSQGCADGHIHQGAALPLEVLIHWVAGALSRLSRKDENPTPELVDRKGNVLRLEPLLLLLRLTQDRGTPFDLELVAMCAQASHGNEVAWNQLRGIEVGPSSAVPGIADISQLKKTLLADKEYARLTSLLRVEAVIHNALLLQRPGLDHFVAMFDVLGEARRSRRSRESKRAYFERAIRQHANVVELEAMELRLGELALTGQRSSGLREFRADIRAALSGYEAYLVGGGRPVRVTFPLGFIRSNPVSSRYWRYDCSDLFSLVADLTDLLSGRDHVAAFVDGIDVCGLEEAAPVWLFAPAFESFSSWCRDRGLAQSFRFHVGEWNWSPLNGLRGISEFLSTPITGPLRRRIGHGLALDSSSWDRVLDTPSHEVLDDLVWSWYTLQGIGEDDLARAVEVACRKLVPMAISGADINAYEPDLIECLWSAYALRQSSDALCRIGMLSRRGDGSLRFLDGEPSLSSDMTTRLLVAGLARDGVTANVLRDLAERAPVVVALLQDCYQALRPALMRAVREADALIEVCPTSNVVAGGVRGYDRHPLSSMIAEGLKVTINTDDPSMFHVDIIDEYRHVLPLISPQVSDIARLSREVVASSVNERSLDSDLRSAVESL